MLLLKIEMRIGGVITDERKWRIASIEECLKARVVEV